MLAFGYVWRVDQLYNFKLTIVFIKVGMPLLAFFKFSLFQFVYRGARWYSMCGVGSETKWRHVQWVRAAHHNHALNAKPNIDDDICVHNEQFNVRYGLQG
jgi:hypothetical protein